MKFENFSKKIFQFSDANKFFNLNLETRGLFYFV